MTMGRAHWPWRSCQPGHQRTVCFHWNRPVELPYEDSSREHWHQRHRLINSTHAVHYSAVASAVDGGSASFGNCRHADCRWISFSGKNCRKCHDADVQKGGLDLTGLAFDAKPETVARWVQVLDRVQAGEMPPKKAASA